MPKLSPDARRRKAEYNEAWRREHTRRIGVRLNVRTDADVLERLDAVPNVTAYIVGLIRADIAAGRQPETEQHKEEHTMKEILIHNGRDSVTPAEALAAYPMETLAEYMDDDAREQVHAELAPCTDEEFLARYLEIAPDDLIIP